MAAPGVVGVACVDRVSGDFSHQEESGEGRLAEHPTAGGEGTGLLQSQVSPTCLDSKNVRAPRGAYSCCGRWADSEVLECPT